MGITTRADCAFVTCAYTAMVRAVQQDLTLLPLATMRRRSFSLIAEAGF